MGTSTKEIIKKAAIYDPYLDTLGGGERYCLTIAEALLEQGYQVDLFWDGDKDILSKAEKRFSLDISKLNLVSDCFHLRPHQIEDVLESGTDVIVKTTHINTASRTNKIKALLDKIIITSKYDVFFFLSDGSVPFLFSKQNFLHVQVPFTFNLSLKNTIITFLKSLTLNKIIVNSEFTKKFTSKYLPKNTTVLYPPVDVSKFSPGNNKEKIILSVGRFDNILNAKRQDVLIEAFTELYKRNPSWKLVLAGGSLLDPERNNYLHHLKYLAQNLPVDFVVNPSFSELQSLYSSASIYWHAAGYEIDENINPENTEHFGITIVEAMSAGLVPVVIKKGGIPEIIIDSQNGFLWQNKNDLISKTQLLIGSLPLLQEMSQKSIESSHLYSKEIFKQKFINLLK